MPSQPHRSWDFRNGISEGISEDPGWFNQVFPEEQFPSAGLDHGFAVFEELWGFGSWGLLRAGVG